MYSGEIFFDSVVVTGTPDTSCYEKALVVVHAPGLRCMVFHGLFVAVKLSIINNQDVTLFGTK